MEKGMAINSDLMTMEKIVESGILDTENPISIEKYKRNLAKLVEKAKRDQSVSKFFLIRNDDFFPEDYYWRVNSYTNGEFRILTKVKKQERKSAVSFLEWLKGVGEDNISAMDESILLYYPAKFSPNKHFTINTALGLTGEYNFVNANRLYTIIDTIDNFLESGYGYSLAPWDAYLDVAHEPLKISKEAIVLIPIDKKEEIASNPRLVEELSKRKVVFFKGNRDLAINMLLTENGALTTRLMNDQHDLEVSTIIESSIKELCYLNNLDYAVPHGMGGHFTSYIDQYETSDDDWLKSFVNYINEETGTEVIDYNDVDRYKTESVRQTNWNKGIDEIGATRFEELLDSFNCMAKDTIEKKKATYLEDRKKVTPKISALFKDTFNMVKRRAEDLNFFTSSDELVKLIIGFFISPEVEQQVEYAKQIQALYSDKKRRLN